MRGYGAVTPLPCRSLQHGSPGASLPGTPPGSTLLMPLLLLPPAPDLPAGLQTHTHLFLASFAGMAPGTSNNISASLLCSPISGVDTIIYPAECLSTFTHVVPHPLEVTSSVLLSVSLDPGMVPVQLPSSPI